MGGSAKKNCSDGACQPGRTEMGNNRVLGEKRFGKRPAPLPLTLIGSKGAACPQFPLRAPFWQRDEDCSLHRHLLLDYPR